MYVLFPALPETHNDRRRRRLFFIVCHQQTRPKLPSKSLAALLFCHDKAQGHQVELLLVLTEI